MKKPDGNSQGVGVIDMGSNSLRFVAYDSQRQLICNEKKFYGLGRDLAKTGHLNPAGIVMALKALVKYRQMADDMHIAPLSIIATAALRQAQDGTNFLKQVKAVMGLTPKILTGLQEARFAAAGVLAALPDAIGIVGDLGGGSLELAQIGQGRKLMSLPLGPLQLGNQKNARVVIDRELKAVAWLSALAGGNLYIVGGFWRSIGKAYLHAHGRSLQDLQGFAIPAGDIAAFAQDLIAMPPESIATIRGINRKRQDYMAMSALLLTCVIAIARPAQIVFSTYGLREGFLFSQPLPSDGRMSRRATASICAHT